MNREYSEKFLRTAKATASGDPGDPSSVLHRAYDAILAGKFDEFGSWMTDDVEMNISGFGQLDGSWRGRADVVEATRRNFGALSGQQPEIEAMISQGDSVAVLLRESGVFRSSGQAYSVRCVQWFTFAGGKIRKIDEIIASIWKNEH
jgi:ketosteroid isomerase-like protein